LLNALQQGDEVSCRNKDMKKTSKDKMNTIKGKGTREGTTKPEKIRRRWMPNIKSCGGGVGGVLWRGSGGNRAGQRATNQTNLPGVGQVGIEWGFPSRGKRGFLKTLRKSITASHIGHQSGVLISPATKALIINSKHLQSGGGPIRGS